MTLFKLPSELKTIMYSGNEILSNDSLDNLLSALDTDVFSTLYDKVTIEYSDGFKMDCDASKWAVHGRGLLLCRGAKIIVSKLK